MCDHRSLVQKHCPVDWSKGRQNYLCVHSSKAVHHRVSHLDVFFVEVRFILALKTDHDLCLCSCVIFLYIYPTGLLSSFLPVHHFPDPLFSRPSLDSQLVSFFLCCLLVDKSIGNRSLCHWWEQAIPHDLVYQIGDQCRCLPNFKIVIWTVHFLWKKTDLSVELYCLHSKTQYPAGFPERKQAEGLFFLPEEVTLLSSSKFFSVFPWRESCSLQAASVDSERLDSPLICISKNVYNLAWNFNLPFQQ